MPLAIAVIDADDDATATIAPENIALQGFIAQLLPLGRGPHRSGLRSEPGVADDEVDRSRSGTVRDVDSRM